MYLGVMPRDIMRIRTATLPCTGVHMPGREHLLLKVPKKFAAEPKEVSS